MPPSRITRASPITPPDASSPVNGKIRWTFGQSGTYDTRIAWGAALDSIPGQDALLVQGRPSDPYTDLINYFNANFSDFINEHEPPPARDLKPQERAYRLQSAVDLARERCGASNSGRRSTVNDETSACHNNDDMRDELAEARDDMHEWLDAMNELNDQRVHRAGPARRANVRQPIHAPLCLALPVKMIDSTSVPPCGPHSIS